MKIVLFRCICCLQNIKLPILLVEVFVYDFFSLWLILFLSYGMRKSKWISYAIQGNNLKNITYNGHKTWRGGNNFNKNILCTLIQFPGIPPGISAFHLELLSAALCNHLQELIFVVSNKTYKLEMQKDKWYFVSDKDNKDFLYVIVVVYYPVCCSWNSRKREGESWLHDSQWYLRDLLHRCSPWEW